MDKYLLNLSNKKNKLTIDPGLGKFEPLTDPTQIPAGPEGMTLYIIGHAVPNGLFDGQGRSWPETVIAEEIRKKRDEKYTLIVWDVCFAQSFQQIGDTGSWPPNKYVHIFSCQAHERTWHSPKAGETAETLFSAELAKALGGEKLADWEVLQARLREQLGNLQKPTIVGACQTPAYFLQ